MNGRFAVPWLFAVATLVHAQDASYMVGGYAKYLFSASDLPGAGTMVDHQVHTRINTRWYVSDALSAACEVRVRAYCGGTVRNTPAFVDLIRNMHEFVRGDALFWNARSSVGYGEIDRLWVDWTSGPLEITLGRQRFGVGTNLVWNPTDLFNPLSVLDFDYEERPAYDGVRIQYYLGPLSKIEVAAKPGKTSATATTALAFTTNAVDYDFHVLVARKGGLWALGSSWAGDIGGGGFRGEISLSQQPAETGFGLLDFSRSDALATSIALSGDYTFPSSLYLHTEVLYNSAGVTRDAGAFAHQAQMLGLLSPARWSLFGEVSYDISPLIRGSVFGIHNPVDRSNVLVPSIAWSLVTNLDLTVLGLIFRGEPLTEFGGYGTSGYLRLKWSF